MPKGQMGASVSPSPAQRGKMPVGQMGALLTLNAIETDPALAPKPRTALEAL
ncbi:hypothetical protein GCM10027431_07310 [Lysobacter rhizosphaerae]